MAATAMSSSVNKSPPPRHRRRIVTYGKAKQFAAQIFDDEFDDRPAPTSQSTLNALPRARKQHQDHTTVPQVSELAMSSAKTAAQDDMFDVPSSEDEGIERSQSSAKKLPAFIQDRKIAATSSSTKAKQSSQLPTRSQQRSMILADTDTKSSRKRKRGDHNARSKDVAARSPQKDVMVKTESDSDGKAVPSRGSSVSHNKRTLVTAADVGRIPESKTIAQTDRATAVKRDPGLTFSVLSPEKSRRSLDHARSLSPKIIVNHNARSPRYKSASAEPTNPVTPMSASSRSEAPASDGRGLTTPRQTQLWGQLLSGAEPDATDKKIDFDRLNLQTDDDEPSTAAGRRLSRRRLIDTLIPSATEADSSSSSASDEDEDVTMGDAFSGNESSQAPWSSQTTIPSSQQGKQSSQQQQLSHVNLKNTYAGQRSYLEEPAMTLDQLLTQPLDMDEIVAVRKEPSRHRDELDFPDNASDEERSAIKSIHELRAQGGTRRLEDDISTLCEELEDHTRDSLSNRRSAVLDLFKKLTDSSFRSIFLQNGYEARVFSRCAQEADPILGSGIAACLIQILDTMTDLRPASNIFQTGIYETLSKILVCPLDIVAIAKDRKSNMSKISQLAVADFKASLIALSAWKDLTDLKTITPRLLTIKALELLTRRLKEAGTGHRVLRFDLLGELLSILESFFDQTTEDTHLITGNTDIIPVQLELILSMLESSTIDPLCCSDTSLWTPSHLRRLVHTMDMAIAVSLPNSSGICNLTVRLCISLANNNPRTCDLFAQQSFVSRLATLVTTSFAAQQGQSSLQLLHSAKFTNETVDAAILANGQSNLDNLLLSLGALINLAEYSDSVRLCFLLPDYSGQGRASDHDHLGDFLRIFKSLREERRRIIAAPPPAGPSSDKSAGGNVSATSTQASINVAGSYLAVFIGNLCQNELIRARVRASFSPSFSATGPENGSLREVIDAVEEFIVYNLEVDRANPNMSGAGSSSGDGVVQDTQQGELVGEAWAAFTRRLQSVAESLRSFP